ncbi:hypothetical protein Rhopal_003718-T1 [Rhodotorula paludigena]|uniref:Proteophosphoglycan ppg4 n=1 Tax=Rhodotorula paludigena TaxID=86838 RepID=A0AAV5GLC6_9BASI|nr:hypothetical protein Rhopal_003718-T1 [Rhodotorula paludigena]
MPVPVVKDKSKTRRIPRKAVPSFSEHESSSAAGPAGTLWSETCDERDLPPLPLDAGRRGSAGSTLSVEEDYAATCAMLIASYRRRASIPSPAAIAANDALSPRLARLAAFTNTLESIAGGAAQGRRLSMEEAGATSWELPDLELPWLPTLFPDGTPIVDPLMTSPASSPPASYAPTFSSPASTAKATFPSAFTPIRLVGAAPPSPALSGTTCYPRSSPSSSPSVASSASFTSRRRSSESSCSSSSSAGDSLVSTYSSLASTPSKEPNADCSAPSEARQTTFRVVAADGTNILIPSPAPASPSLFSTSRKDKHALVPPRSAARTAAGRTKAGRRPAPSTAGLSRAWTQVEGENDEGEEVLCVGLRV